MFAAKCKIGVVIEAGTIVEIVGKDVGKWEVSSIYNNSKGIKALMWGAKNDSLWALEIWQESQIIDHLFKALNDMPLYLSTLRMVLKEG